MTQMSPLRLSQVPENTSCVRWPRCCESARAPCPRPSLVDTPVVSRSRPTITGSSIHDNTAGVLIPINTNQYAGVRRGAVDV